MNKDLEYRLSGLASIVYGLHHSLGLMKYISFSLHDEPFNLSNNLGLLWIWRSLMANQLVDFYKVIAKKEKCSFTKIINVSKELKCEINYEKIEKDSIQLKDDYDKTDFEKVRSKYIAHQDLNVEIVETDLITIDSFTKRIAELSQAFFAEFRRDANKLSNEVVNSFKKVFKTIDEYEKVKAFLVAAQIRSQKTVKISDIAQTIKQK